MIIKTIATTAREQGLRGVRLLLTYYVYRLLQKFVGPGVCCPVCDWQAKQFHPYLLQPMWVRPGAACPQCGALERHRALLIFYQRLLEDGSGQGQKFLHFAPEESASTFFRSTPIEYLVSDYEGPGIGDMQDIKHPNNTFDAVLSHHVLEHVEDDAKGLREIHRVLKDGGVSYLSVPLDWDCETTEYGFADPDDNFHFRHYGADITAKFGDFRWRRIDFSDLLTSEEIKRFGIDPNEPFFELRKEPADA